MGHAKEPIPGIGSNHLDQRKTLPPIITADFQEFGALRPVCSCEALGSDEPSRGTCDGGFDFEGEDVIGARREGKQDDVPPCLGDCATRAVAAERHDRAAARVSHRARCILAVDTVTRSLEVEEFTLDAERKRFGRGRGDSEGVPR